MQLNTISQGWHFFWSAFGPTFTTRAFIGWLLGFLVLDTVGDIFVRLIFG